MARTVIGPAPAAARIGGAGVALTDDDVRGFVHEQLAHADLTGRSVCVLVPDATRTCPLPLLMSALHEALHTRVSRLTVLVALGTHHAMSDSALAAHLGYAGGALEERYPGTAVVNHAWWVPATFVDVGTIAAERVSSLSEGMLREAVPVRVNRAVVEHDVTLIVSPVFPHEVIGFSGGNKYLFPGVSGRELIDVSHWLGALITSARIIGTLGDTPVRALVDDAAAMLPCRRLALCVVTRREGGLCAMTFGDSQAAWAAAAAESAQAHIRYVDAPVGRVLSVVPGRYDELWSGAKGFYKVEPVVADGGEVVLYAPHIREIAAAHPHVARVGYHCRDFFLAQWHRYKDVPWADLAHSTHLRGAGTYSAVDGERLRLSVTLATGIPEELTRSVNLGYLDPASVDVEEWQSAPDTLVVHDAGEDLYRLR